MPVSENHLNFVYQLEGDVKEVNIFHLAPTLLALGELLQESNRVLNPNGKEIGVNVKPFREGSFIVDLTIFPDSQLHQLLNFLHPHSLEQLKTLLECIGLIGTGTTASAVGAVKAIRYLGAKPKTVEEVKPGEYRLTASDGKTLTVDSSTNMLLNNPIITKNIYNIYGPPMEAQHSVSDIRTYIKDEEETSVRVRRDEIPSIKEYAQPMPTIASLTEVAKEIVHEEVFLNPKRGAFGDDPKDWSFMKGGEVITATVKDRGFLADVESGKIRLNHSDLLTVTLLERQKVRGTIVQKPSYEITKVTGYEKAGPPTQ